MLDENAIFGPVYTELLNTTTAVHADSHTANRLHSLMLQQPTELSRVSLVAFLFFTMLRVRSIMPCRLGSEIDWCVSSRYVQRLCGTASQRPDGIARGGAGGGGGGGGGQWAARR